MAIHKGNWKRAGIAVLYGACVWAVLLGVAVVLEKLLNSPGPEYAMSIEPFFLAALFLGWVPALIVVVWKLRSK